MGNKIWEEIIRLPTKSKRMVFQQQQNQQNPFIMFLVISDRQTNSHTQKKHRNNLLHSTDVITSTHRDSEDCIVTDGQGIPALGRRNPTVCKR